MTDRTPMAAHQHRLVACALGLVLLAAAFALLRNADHSPAIAEPLLGVVPAADELLENSDDDEEEGDVQQQQSSACRCWSASDEAGSYFEIECKCRGQRVASVPASLPNDVHRM